MKLRCHSAIIRILECLYFLAWKWNCIISSTITNIYLKIIFRCLLFSKKPVPLSMELLFIRYHWYCGTSSVYTFNYTECFRITLRLSCPMVLTHFPMDRQECQFKMESCKSYVWNIIPYKFITDADRRYMLLKIRINIKYSIT